MWTRWRVGSRAALISALALVAWQPAQTMREVLAALQELMPKLLLPETFEAPAERHAIETALESLWRAAASLDRHGQGFSPSYDRVRRGFAQDTEEALRAFRAGDFEISRFLLRHVTENCFDCHSRLPAADRGDLAGAFASTVELEHVPAGERMRLLVATRQFAAAQEYAEALLADPEAEPALIDRMGIFEDYLQVCLRVERGFDRPRLAFERFLQRSDLPVYLQMQVTDWAAALREFAALDISDRMAVAEGLLGEAQERNLYLQDRRGLAHATLASGLLHEYVLSAPDGATTTARAYYLLGLAESTIARSRWVPETEYFLELAVRSAPGSETARDAYVFLEQFVIAMYTGSEGTDLPAEVRERLSQLRELAFR